VTGRIFINGKPADASDVIKHCPKCGNDKCRREFSGRKTSPDGLQPHCKDCDRVYAAAYRAKHKAALAVRRIERRQQGQGGA